MLLSSYNRLLRYLAGRDDDNLTDNKNNKRDVLTWLPAISNKIKLYLNRTKLIESKTEYFDVNSTEVEYWIKNAPVSSITSVKEDSTGRYNGDESTLDSDDYHIGTESASVVTLYPRSFRANRGLQIVYTGGLAYDPVKSVFAVADETGWDAGKYCIGSTSGAVGLVSATGTDELTIEVLYGIFVVGETITEYDNEDGSGSAGADTTISSKTRTALCEAYPEIVEACNNEIRYMIQHKQDFENDSSERDGVTIRRSADKKAMLQLETRLLLDLKIPVL